MALLKIGKLGVPVLLVHMFVLYYGVLSNITPPVAIAAYAAAPIAGANPLMTGVQAVRIAAVGFTIPFVLVYNPSLALVLGVDWLPFVGILVRLPVAIWLVASASSGAASRWGPKEWAITTRRWLAAGSAASCQCGWCGSRDP